jgi:pyruvate kinase
LEQQERRTKIVATLGPASNSPAMIRKLMDAGVNVFRLNLSHGSHETHGAAIRDIRRAASEARQPVAILLAGSTTVPGATNMMKVHRVGMESTSS